MEDKAHVPLRTRALHEIKSIALVTLYFAACFLVLMFMKRLVLAQYGVEFRGISIALIGALVAAKVVLIMEKVPLGDWVRARPVIVDTLLRTLLYMVGVAVVQLLETAFESRHESGGFWPALLNVLHHRDIHHILANTIGIGGALLAFNVMTVLQLHLGSGHLRRLFLVTTRAELVPHDKSHEANH